MTTGRLAGGGLSASPDSSPGRPGQQEAARLTLTQKVAMLTGGPGCGKSFTVRSIVELATAKNAAVVRDWPGRKGRPALWAA
jgi:AAA domain